MRLPSGEIHSMRVVPTRYLRIVTSVFKVTPVLLAPYQKTVTLICDEDRRKQGFAEDSSYLK